MRQQVFSGETPPPVSLPAPDVFAHMAGREDMGGVLCRVDTATGALEELFAHPTGRSSHVQPSPAVKI